MWFHQRTGRDTAISYPLWIIVLGGLIAIAALNKTGLLWLIPILAVTGAIFGIWMRIHHGRWHQLEPDESCRHCRRELSALAEREYREEVQADMERLRDKYRR